MPHITIPNAADETGQTMTEYALLVSLIAVVVAAAFPAVVTALQALFSAVTAAFGSVG